MDFGAGAASRSPLPSYDYDGQGELFPDEPASRSSLLGSLKRILENSMNAASPGWMGHMTSMPNIASILGDFISAFLDNNMLAAETAPVFTAMEWRLGREFGDRFGLGSRSMGNLVAGGSIANLQALIVARNEKVGSDLHAWSHTGVRPVIIASEIAHISIKKAAGILGLGADGKLIGHTCA